MRSTTVAYVYVLTYRNKVYVGSAVNPLIRKKGHFTALQRGNHENSYLQRTWNKYSKEGPEFSFEVVAICDRKERWVVEQQWIDRLRASDRKFGFNAMHSVRKLLPSPVMSKKLKAYWKKRWADPKYKESQTNVLISRLANPKVKKKMSMAKINAWAKLEFRELMVAKHKEHASQPKVKARLSDQAKNAWADPIYRAKQMAERKARFADPVFRAKLSEAAKNRRCKYSSHKEIV